MKLIFDDIFLVHGTSGIARYWKSVFLEWSKSDLPETLNVEIVILNRSGHLSELGFESINFPRVGIGHDYAAEDRRLIEKMCESIEADVFLSSYYTFSLGTPTIGFVYDFIPERKGLLDQHWSWLERHISIYASRAFIGISESTIKDLTSLYPWVERSDCSVALPGVNHDVFRRRTTGEIRKFKNQYGINNYLVIAGHRGDSKHYKNFHLILESVKLGHLKDFDLVLTGGEPVTELETQILRDKGVRTVRLELTDDDLAVCFSGADAMVYPSLYEGFGLPPLESLAVGTPVVTTQFSSLPESVGNLSKSISGDDPEELAAQIENATKTKWKEFIQTEGPRWASAFQWTRTADEILRNIVDRHAAGRIRTHPEVISRLKEYNEGVRLLQC
jgi:glycosyltransferase involved in cell wall biosynthesis